MILMTWAAVILTESENSNMDFPHARATAEAPATAVERALVGGYEVLTRFATGNGLPLLTTLRRGSEPRREPAQHPGQGICVQRTRLLTSCWVGFQFVLGHNGARSQPRRRNMVSPEQKVEVRLEAARLLVQAGIPAEKLIEVATPLSEWILGNCQPQPCSTGDTASASSPT
jgi:hypothetical protein